MTESKITKDQSKTFGPRADAQLVEYYGHGAMLTAHVRYDDSSGNGYNTFSLTGEVVTAASRRRRDIEAIGQLHDDIARVFPELAPFTKWHMTSAHGPMHYIPNTLYWLGWHGWTDGKPDSPPNLAHARSTAVWPDLPETFVAPRAQPARTSPRAALPAPVEKALRDRLADLQRDFRVAVESLGFEY